MSDQNRDRTGSTTSRSSAAPSRNGSAVRTGIQPLDARVGGLRAGGTYLLGGLPGSGRLAALLQFLAEGLGEGRVGLVTTAPRGRIFEEAAHWGFDLEPAWRDGRLALLSYQPEFQRRLASAADPGEVLEEMQDLLGPDVRRLALYPAVPLWEARSGTTLESHVVGWLDAHPATTLAAVGGDLEEFTTPASDRVLKAATGVFLLERLPTGQRRLRIRRMSPPVEDGSPITLDLAPGRGYVAPTGHLDRRSTDRRPGHARRVLFIRMDPQAPAELGAWLDRWYETAVANGLVEGLRRLQEDPFGLVLVYLSAAQVDDALRAVPVLRRTASSPVILATADRVRAEDRVRALEAGASDFLSDPLSVGELASRAEKTMITGAPPLGTDPVGTPEARGQEGTSGDVDTVFARAVRGRLESPRGSVFTFVRIALPDDLALWRGLRDALEGEIRHEHGDFLGPIPGGTGLVLHGAGLLQAEAFLRRVRGRIGEGWAKLDIELLSGILDPDRIRDLVPLPRP
jgi:CheY-like chemotaxis protein